MEHTPRVPYSSTCFWFSVTLPSVTSGIPGSLNTLHSYTGLSCQVSVTSLPGFDHVCIDHFNYICTLVAETISLELTSSLGEITTHKHPIPIPEAFICILLKVRLAYKPQAPWTESMNFDLSSTPHSPFHICLNIYA